MRSWRRTLRPLPGLGGLLAFLLIAARPAAGLNLAAGHLTPAAGILWGEPLDANVRALYSGGPGFSGAVGYTLPPRIRVEARAGWMRRSAHPAAMLASQSDSRLTLIPVTLEAQVLLPASGAHARPYFLAGPAVVFAREQFTTALLTTSSETTGGDTDWGAVAGLGMESRVGHIRVRVAGRAIVTGGHHAVLRADGRTDSRGATARASLFTIGLEAALP